MYAYAKIVPFAPGMLEGIKPIPPIDPARVIRSAILPTKRQPRHRNIVAIAWIDGNGEKYVSFIDEQSDVGSIMTIGAYLFTEPEPADLRRLSKLLAPISRSLFRCNSPDELIEIVEHELLAA